MLGVFARRTKQASDGDSESESPYHLRHNHGGSQDEFCDLLDHTLEVHHFGPDDSTALGKDGHFHGVETREAKEQYL